VPHTNRISLSIAGTAALALALLPLGITPANAARVSEGTTSSIGVIEASPNAQQFNLKSQSASTGLVARGGKKGGNVGGTFQALLQQLLDFLGISTTNQSGRHNENNSPLD
jgi:hypothetical protein